MINFSVQSFTQQNYVDTVDSDGHTLRPSAVTVLTILEQAELPIVALNYKVV